MPTRDPGVPRPASSPEPTATRAKPQKALQSKTATATRARTDRGAASHPRARHLPSPGSRIAETVQPMKRSRWRATSTRAMVVAQRPSRKTPGLPPDNTVVFCVVGIDGQRSGASIRSPRPLPGTVPPTFMSTSERATSVSQSTTITTSTRASVQRGKVGLRIFLPPRADRQASG